MLKETSPFASSSTRCYADRPRTGDTWVWGGSRFDCRPTGASESNPESPLNENYSLLVTS
jgi:hypothetical protein